MIFVLGCCALVQALFLPGFLGCRALGVRGGLRTATTSFALSLVANAALVPLLVACGIYRRPVLLALFAAEWVVAGVMLSRRAPRLDLSPERPRTFDLVEGIAAGAVVALLLWYATRVARAATGIFDGWDDVVSWNRWALDWAHGRFPAVTHHYPQLLPAAWSLVYVFTGSERAQFFARGMMPLFGVATILVTVDAARTPRRVGFLAAAWLAGLALARINNVTTGYADVAVAFFVQAACCELLRSGDSPEESRRRLLFSALFAAGAALTKQAGLLIVAAWPLLEWKLLDSRALRARARVGAGVLLAAIALPWYAWTEFQIRTGHETSEIGYVTREIFAGRPLLDRLAGGFGRLGAEIGGPIVMAALVLLLAVGLADRRVRWVALLVGAPGLLLWGLGFSYDLRNVSAALGPCALGCGAGLAWLAGRRSWPSARVPVPAGYPPRIDPRVVALVVAAAVIATGFAIPDAAILARHDRLQRTRVGDAAANEALFRYRDSPGFTGRILTGEGLLLAYTPGWDSIFVVSTFADTLRFAREAERHRIAYVLAPPPGTGPVGPMIDRWVREARYREAMRAGRWTLLVRAPCPSLGRDSAAGGDSRR